MSQVNSNVSLTLTTWFCVASTPAGVCVPTDPRHTSLAQICPGEVPQKQMSEMRLMALGTMTDDGTAPPEFNIPLASA